MTEADVATLFNLLGFIAGLLLAWLCLWILLRKS